MKTTTQLQKEHQNELNNFRGLFFAFSNKQLKEGLEKVGLNDGDFDKILSVGAGGYIRKDRVEAFHCMFSRQKKELKENRKRPDVIKIKYAGIDSWSRPVFKSIEKPYRYYGSVTELFDYGESEANVLKKIDEECLCYFGNSFNCEPMGTLTGNIKIIK